MSSDPKTLALQDREDVAAAARTGGPKGVAQAFDPRAAMNGHIGASLPEDPLSACTTAWGGAARALGMRARIDGPAITPAPADGHAPLERDGRRIVVAGVFRPYG